MNVKTKGWNNRLELGEYLRLAREEKKLSQRIMADILGCSAQYLTLLERGGVSAPGVPMLRAMAEKYELDIDVLTDVYYPRKQVEIHGKRDVIET
jgi:transcriptional regulator with XRE-family HTH domain